MQDSNSKITHFHYMVFIIWLVFTVIAAIYFISSRLVSYDPEEKLTGQNSVFVMQELRKIAQLNNVDLSDTIIHFTSDHCACTQYSEAHKKEINEQAGLTGFKVINVNLPAKLSTIIPSTPSIMIVSDTQDLLYLGPYSIGLACTESNGYVETVMKNYGKGYRSDLILSDASGCYCNL
ncbi:DUF6436 domain-containing protein [Psychromonas sp. L1A2]|uniref:DUF6436 domain-containing protein n=1 Tax=Psychromonas sp. L1A2 TaxID=2686356 RepID=UPI00135A9156|nr:DUF6436 domain-containing protein [Psychromonas sp. L1A2]